jgi:UDP-2,3-diacylglucosamine hydrolase
LLLHGDTLCTDDIAYQQFRRQARDPAWQAGILAKPYGERVALAASIRERSDTEKATKAADIMDVSLATVEQVFRKNGYIDMIHGHTHRPATHVHMVDGHRCTRQVLADWHTSAKWLSDNDVGK